MIRVPAAIVLVCGLSACTPAMDALMQTVRAVVPADDSVAGARLDSNFRYLRVTLGGRTALLAQGFVESNPQGPIEVWYSGEREVVRLQNGRVVGVVGTTTEWRNVSLREVPSWSAVARAGQPVRLLRTRDVMPGYRFGVRDELLVRAIAPPQDSQLRDLDPQSLTWFEERFQPEPTIASAAAHVTALYDERALRPSRYAVRISDGDETVVYGEQCIAADFCFTWQRWPAKPVVGEQ